MIFVLFFHKQLINKKTESVDFRYHSMIKEYKLSVPQALAGITLRQYQKYLKILDKWDKEDEVYIKTKMLQIFCGLEIEDTFKIPLNNFDFAIDVINKCFKEETPLVPRFSMSATDEYGEETVVEFGFIPKLDEMTFGEFIDLDGYISDWDKMHKAMAVLFRPVIFKKNEFYRVMDYEGSHKYSDVMLDMPVNVAIGAMVFFYRLGSKLPSYTLDYLQQELKGKGIPPQLKQTLDKNGVGINQYLQSLKKMQQRLTKLQSFQYTPV